MCLFVRVRVHASLSPPAADFANDIFRFDPATATWTELRPFGPAPVERRRMGFAATPDGMLYVFGGMCCGLKEQISGMRVVKAESVGVIDGLVCEAACAPPLPSPLRLGVPA